MTTIVGIDLLPTNPFAGSPNVAVIITSGVPSYYKVTGIDLDKIVSVHWYPRNPSSVIFETRQMILLEENITVGTFMIKVLDNFLDTCDRGGKISFRLEDGTTLVFPTITVGPVSTGRLWQAPTDGLSTG